MNKKLLLAPLLALGAFLILSTSAIHAQDTDLPANADTDSAEQTDERESVEDRIQKRKAASETRVDEQRARQIAAKCKAAQTRLTAHLTGAKTVQQNRQRIYENVTTKLNGIVVRLTASDVDTAELESAIVQYSGMVERFLERFELYILALEDASTIDCETDSEAFVLAIEDAKVQAIALKAESKEIRSFVQTTIISIIDEIKAELGQRDTSDRTDQGA